MLSIKTSCLAKKMLMSTQFKTLCSALTLILCINILVISPVKAELDVDWTIVQNPRIKEAVFFLHQENYFDGINRLIALRSFTDLNEETEISELLLGTLYLAYGMPNEATEIFLDMLDRSTNTVTQEQLWFHVAKIQYQRGNYDLAEKSLNHISKHLSADLGEQQTFLEALLLMRRSQYKLAVEKLQSVKSNSEWAMYSLYNLAVALAKIGRKEESAGTFDVLSKITGENSKEIQALKDKSSMALGYIYLNDNDPNRARQYMQQVQLDGPLSNKAMLGLGWSLSALNEHKKSLVVWMELASRQKTDVSVLEAYLAIPYAYDKLTASSQAIKGYETAINEFKTSITQIDNIISRIKSGDMLKPILDTKLNFQQAKSDGLLSLPDKIDQQYLMYIFSSHEFQESYKSYRELKDLSNRLLTWESNIEKFRGISTTFREAYMDRILQQQAQTDQLLDELEEYMKSISINSLEYNKRKIDTFIGKAKFSMAQIFDRSTRNADFQ